MPIHPEFARVVVVQNLQFPRNRRRPPVDYAIRGKLVLRLPTFLDSVFLNDGLLIVSPPCQSCFKLIDLLL